MSDQNENMFSNPRFWVITGIVVLAAFLRFLPHPPNFAPVAAIAMFGGAYFADKRLALLIPMAILLISDMFIGFHNLMWAVYLSFAAVVGIGYIIRKNPSFMNITAGALSGSIVFFVVTNFAVWAVGSGMYYPKSIEGLMMCYTAAIPFFHYTLLGDLFYSGVFFGSFAVAKRSFPSLALN